MAYTYTLHSRGSLVYFGLRFVRPDNQLRDKVQIVPGKKYDERAVRENFKNLFDSIGENDIKNSDVYRQVLEQEVFRERLAFDVMKKEIRTAQKNAYKRRNPYKNSNMSESIVAAKRGTEYDDRQTILNAVGKHRWRGIMEAIEHDDLDAVRLWVEVDGTSVNKRNENKQTTAHLAAAKDDVPLLKYLLQHDNSSKVNKSLCRLRDKDGLTVFHTAVQKGAIKCVRYLVDENGVVPNLLDPVSVHPENNAVHLAAENGQIEMLKYLIREKHVDVNVRNKLQQSPVFLAAEASQLEAIKYLAEQCRADLNLTDFNRNTVVHWATVQGNLSVLKYLLDDSKTSFDVNARNDLGDTPLNLAAKFNRFSCIEYLVEEKKADMNVPDIQYRTPLYNAAFFAYIDVVKYLVEHGANTELKDDHGRRPLTAAATEEIKKYLKENSLRSRKSSKLKNQNSKIKDRVGLNVSSTDENN